jgi:hypothetical protein
LRVQIEKLFLDNPMPELTAEQAYKADLAEIERLDAVSWISAGPEDMSTARAEDLRAMDLSELSQLVVQAEELEPHGRP